MGALDRALGRRTARASSSSDRLLKLNPDGSFRQCNEGYVEGSWIVGRWALVGPRRVKFALNRQYYGPPYDIVMEGALKQEDNSLVVDGIVYKGRLVLPRSDPNFFRDGFADATVLGEFRLVQSVATTTVQGASLDGALLEDDGGFQ